MFRRISSVVFSFLTPHDPVFSSSRLLLFPTTPRSHGSSGAWALLQLPRTCSPEYPWPELRTHNLLTPEILSSRSLHLPTFVVHDFFWVSWVLRRMGPHPTFEDMRSQIPKTWVLSTWPPHTRAPELSISRLLMLPTSELTNAWGPEYLSPLRPHTPESPNSQLHYDPGPLGFTPFDARSIPCKSFDGSTRLVAFPISITNKNILFAWNKDLVDLLNLLTYHQPSDSRFNQLILEQNPFVHKKCISTRLLSKLNYH